MKKTGVDVIISAPQKGWTGPACVGMAMLSERAVEACQNTTSTSMVLNLKKWLEVADSYTNGGFMYYTTMPTDALVQFRNVAAETQNFGFKRVKDDFLALGREARAMMASKGLKSVAAKGYEAPGVVVSYTDEPAMFPKFKAIDMQIAAGVPFMINEPAQPHLPHRPLRHRQGARPPGHRERARDPPRPGARGGGQAAGGCLSSRPTSYTRLLGGPPPRSRTTRSVYS